MLHDDRSIDEAFKKTADEGIAADNLIFTRVAIRTKEFIRYISEREIGEISRKYHPK